MKPFFTYFLSLVAAILFGAFAVSNLSAQATANLQIIHISPDPAVSSVDIFVNGAEFLTDVDFRTATAFTEVDAGVDLDVQIAPADAGIENAVGPFTFNLTEDENYQLIASGVVDPSAFTGAAGFTLEAYNMAQTEAADPTMVDVNVHHGSPDAPAVDIYTEQTGNTPAVENLAYPEFTGYVSLAPNNETIGIAGAGGDILVEFSAPLADLNAAGAAITVLASGFFDSNNATESNAFGLLAVLADGTAILLDQVYAPANVQIIHNSPDPAASSVDVFINGELTLPAVEFRTATEFLVLPGDTPLDITISPEGVGIEAGFEFSDVEFTAGESYYIIANGVLDPDAFADNPDGVNTALFFEIIPGAVTSATDGNFDFLLYHGSPDAPAVDIDARNVATLAEAISYTDFSDDYVSVPANTYIIDVFAAGADDPLVSFDADVSTLGGQTAMILASGFLDPSSNNDGPGFGVLVALNDGTTLLLDAVEPEPATANLQIIHNSPDPAVSTVDIFVNGEEFLADVDFRTATAFTEVPAGVDLDVQIAPANAGIENAVGPFTYNLTEDENYQLIASGVVDQSAFTGAAGFTLEAYTMVQTEASDPTMVDVNIHHGSPDAPAVDIYTEQTGNTPAVEVLAYPEFTGYVSLAPNNETIGVAGAGGDILAEFSAPLADLDAAGAAITVLASGFFDIDNASENNGFGLLAVLTDGTAILLDPGMVTSNEAVADGLPERFDLDQNYPNPFNPSTIISYSLPQSSQVTVEVFNITGQRVATLVNANQSAGNYTVNFDASSLSSGMYMYRIQAENFTQTRKMTLIK